MNKKTLTALAVVFLAGSIVNDLFLIDGVSALSWAKIFFFVGSLFAFSAGISTKPLSRPEKSLLIYIFILWATTMLSSGYGPSSQTYSVLTSTLLGFLAFTLIYRSNASFNLVSQVFLGWVVASVLLGICQSFLGLGFMGDRIFLSTIIPGTFRASGLMNDPNYFALLCLSAYGLALQRRSIFLNSLLLTGVLISGSRAALLVITIIWILDFALRHKIIKTTIIFGPIFLVVFLFFGQQLWGKLPSSITMIFDLQQYTSFAVRNSLNDRMAAIFAGVTAFLDYPVFGYGAGNLVNHPDNIHGQVSHNSYIEVLAEHGVVGLLSFIILLIGFLKYALVGRISDIRWNLLNRTTNASCAIMLAAFAIMSATVVTHYSRIMFFILALAALNFRDQTPKKNADKHL